MKGPYSQKPKGPYRVIGIDPGNEKSAWVDLEFDRSLTCPVHISGHGIEDNCEVMQILSRNSSGWEFVAIERIAGMGMAVGDTVFETVFWTGRFYEATQSPVQRIKRHEVKMALCGNTRAKDSNIRQRIIDLFGGAQETKKGGILHGIKADEWQALAVALTFIAQMEERNLEDLFVR